MAGLSIMILVVSSLATGSTRHEVYRTSSGRTYGRIGKRNYMFSLFLSLPSYNSWRNLIMNIQFSFS